MNKRNSQEPSVPSFINPMLPDPPRTPPGFGTKLAALIAVAVAIVSAVVMASSITGCTPPEPQYPQNGAQSFQLLYVRGTGSAGFIVPVVGAVEVEFTTELVGETHCTVVNKASVAGIPIGAGYVPDPVSAPACEEKYPPFRLGQAPIPAGNQPAAPAETQPSGKPAEQPAETGSPSAGDSGADAAGDLATESVTTGSDEEGN